MSLTPSSEQLSLITTAATLYHEHGQTQSEIGARLGLSQSGVSRLLRSAERLGIVVTVVRRPAGVYPEVEQALKQRYHLDDAVVVDAEGLDEAARLRALGAAAARHFETSLSTATSIGVSSWSATLVEMVDAMQPVPDSAVEAVVQILGGFGLPGAEVQATHLTERLGRATGAKPVFLPAPGVVASATLQKALLKDPSIARVAALWDELSVVVVGIGGVTPSPLLEHSGNTLGADDLQRLADLGAVGDVCLHYFDVDGNRIGSDLDDRIVGISPESLKRVPRRVAVAGGTRKRAAIRGALAGGWVNSLITDRETAAAILTPASDRGEPTSQTIPAADGPSIPG